MGIDIQKSIQIIKDFKPLETPVFNDGNEDAFRYVVWNLYHRECEAIKSYMVLFENGRYYDSFIIAGYFLETCAILSYIKDNPTEELCRERYNKYFASAIFGRLIACLKLTDNLETEISWQVFVSLLKIFYSVGVNIITKKEQAKEKHEEAIRQINYRLGLNKDKISILKRYYLQIRVREYINAFVKNTAYFDGEKFDLYYQKYCNIKHSNMVTPGASFECNQFDNFAEYVIFLILGIMYYVRYFKF